MVQVLLDGPDQWREIQIQMGWWENITAEKDGRIACKLKLEDGDGLGWQGCL